MLARGESERTASERAYSTLLLAYPKEFRRAYGSQMEQTFGDLCREERERGGPLGLTRLWIRTLRDLALSMISERSKTVGGTMIRARRLVTFGNLMLLNASVLLLCGLALALAPGPMSDAYGLTAAFSDEDPRSTVGNAHFALLRFLGVVSLGFGSLLLATSHLAEMFARRAVSGALFVTYSLGALLLLIQQTEIWVSAVGWTTVAVHLFFAIGYGLFWFRGSIVGVPLDARPLPTGRRL